MHLLWFRLFDSSKLNTYLSDVRRLKKTRRTPWRAAGLCAERKALMAESHLCLTRGLMIRIPFMTQDEGWKAQWREVMSFITENGRNLSKYNLEERRLYTWLKHQRKVMNAGEMKEERITPFKKLLELSERYRWKNQYE